MAEERCRNWPAATGVFLILGLLGIHAQGAEPPPLTIRVHGRILRADGTAAAGARVRILELTQTRGETRHLEEAAAGPEGNYRISAPESDAVLVEFSAEACATVRTPLRQGSGTAGEVLVDAHLLPASPLHGSIVGPAGEPVAGAQVRVRSDPAYGQSRRSYWTDLVTSTGADGGFLLPDTAAGPAHLMVVSPLFVPEARTITLPQPFITVTLASHGAVVQGTVLRLDSGKPVAGARLHLVPQYSSVTALGSLPDLLTVSGADGSFRFERLAAHTYFLRAEASSLFQAPERDEGSSVLVLPERGSATGITVRMYSGHAFTGVIREKGSGAPLQGVVVTTHQSGSASTTATAVTDRAGRFSFAQLIPPAWKGEMSFQLEKEGYGRLGRVQSFFADELQPTAEWEMERQDLIQGVVTDPDGRPLPGVTVGVQSAAASGIEAPRTQTDENGRFRTWVQPNVPSSVWALKEGFLSATSELPASAGEAVPEVKLQLFRGAEIQGVVLRPDGDPHAGATVEVLSAGTTHVLDCSPRIRHETDASGQFSIRGERPREARVVARAAGYAPSEPLELPLQEGTSFTSLSLVLRTAHSIDGRVMTAAGEPAPLVSVYTSSDRSWENVYTQTDADGRYRLTDLPAGTVEVSVSFPNSYERALRRTGVRAGSRNVDFVLSPEAEHRSKSSDQ